MSWVLRISQSHSVEKLCRVFRGYNKSVSEYVCVCVFIIYAVSWNSHSENPFHRKNDLIEFELREVQHLLSLGACQFLSFPLSCPLLSPRLFLYYFLRVLLWLIEFAKYWPHMKLRRFCIRTGEKKVDHDSTWDIQVRERVSISWNSFFMLSIDLANYLSAFSFSF